MRNAILARAFARHERLAVLTALLLAHAVRVSAQAPAAPPASPPAAPAPAGSAPSPAQSQADANTVPKDIAGTETQFEIANELREGVDPIGADRIAALAVQTAPNLRRAQAASERAREAASEALVAVYPRLDLEARYTRLSEHDPALIGQVDTMFDNPATGMPIMAMSDIEIFPAIPDQFLFQARLTYPVSDLFLQILPRYGAAKDVARAQELSARAEAENIALQAREAYYNYARTRATLVVARSALAQTEAQRRDVVALVSAGTLARVEQMRADAQVAAAQVAVARAEGAVALARTALRTLMHRPGEQEIAITEALGQPMPELTETQAQLLARALRQRTEVQALRVMAGVHETTADANAAERFPKLSVAATYDFANPNQRVDPSSSTWHGSWAAMGILSWSPSDAVAGGARAGQAEADRDQTLAELDALEDALRQEVARGYEDYQAARQAMEAALTGIAAAEESYRVRREQFRAGAAVATDVIDAEAELRRARLELINAAIDVRIARARLDRAVGSGQPG